MQDFSTILVCLNPAMKYYLPYQGSLQLGEIVTATLAQEQCVHSNQVITDTKLTYRFKMPNGDTTVVDPMTNPVYVSEQNYIEGTAVCGKQICFRDFAVAYLGKHRFHLGHGRDNHICYDGYVCNDHVVCRVNDILQNTINVQIDPINAVTGQCFKNDLKVQETIYRTRGEALAANDIRVIEGDGTEHILPSLKSKVALNEKQQEIFNALQANIKAALESGMQFVFDEDDCQLSVINALNIPNKKAYSEYEKDISEDAECLIIPSSFRQALDAIFTYTGSGNKLLAPSEEANKQ
jgi:hypothetical protein